MEKKKFIETVGRYAREDWLTRHICLPSLVIAMAIEESDWGRTQEARRYKELFPGNCEAGKNKENGASFRQSIRRNNNYLAVRRQDGLEPNWKLLVGQENYILAVQYLQDAIFPYCPDKDYEARLVQLIEKYELTRFDENTDKIHFQ